MKKLVLLSTALIAMSITACGQSRRAKSEVQEAKEEIRLGNYQEALIHVNEAIERSPDYAEAWLLQADLYTQLGEGRKMMHSYSEASELDVPKAIYYRWADASMRFGYYRAADSLLETYLESNEVPEQYKRQARGMQLNAQYAMTQVASPVSFTPEWLGADVNTLEMQYFPSVSGDGNTLVFTARNMTTAPTDEDFYVSERDSMGWSRARRLTGHLNTSGNEGAQSLSADGNFIFYAGCNRQDGFGSCDIYVSRKLSDGSWAEPFNLGPSINTRFWESQPTISADGKTLFFVRAGNASGQNSDIYFSELKDGRWTPAAKIPGDVNTPRKESSPFLHFDGKTLYFSSNGHLGMGQEDLFVATKQEDGTWGQIRNLGYPINTFQDEFSLVVAPDGKTAYYATDRGRDLDHMELYSFELPEAVRAVPIAWLEGVVVDEVTQDPVQASLSFVSLESGVEVLADENAQDGTFYVSLPSKESYAVNVASPGYLLYSENINLEAQTDATVVRIRIELTPIKSGERAILKNVFFEYDSYELRSMSRIELNRLVDFLSINPEISIRIDGHTDNVGSVSYNRQLSLDRAQAVKDYLVSQGVNSERLHVKGFGADVPIADNDTEEGRGLNRRTEITIL